MSQEWLAASYSPEYGGSHVNWMSNGKRGREGGRERGWERYVLFFWMEASFVMVLG